MKTKAYGLVDIGSGVRIVRAQQGDLDTVLEILEEASRWLSSKGLESQWRSNPAFRQTIKDNIELREIYVLKAIEATVGTITLQLDHQKFYGDPPSDAGFDPKL